MKKVDNVINFNEAIKKKNKDVEKLQKEVYQLTIEDTRAFLRVLGFIRQLSVDGSVKIEIEDNFISLTKSNQISLSNYDEETEELEIEAGMILSDHSTVSFGVDWEAMENDVQNATSISKAETDAGIALCDSIVLLVGYDSLFNEDEDADV